MAANPRFEISSNNPDGATFGYSNSQRSHYAVGVGGPSLDRASSFREGHEGSSRAVTPVGIGPNFVSQGSSALDGKLPPLSQVLSLELIPTGEKQYAKQHELRRAIYAAMAMVGDVQVNVQQKPIEQQGIEELKRMKASLLHNAAKARERSRGLAEAIAKLDKYQSSLQSRKRARAESLAHDRPLISGSGERPLPIVAAAMTANPSKATFSPPPSHPSIADGTLPIPEDKSKGPVLNKRVRTSMLDVRLEGRASIPSFQRSSSGLDRESMKSSSSMGGLAEEKDRAISVGGGEGWEKTKTKGRRSTTKSDCVLASGASEVGHEHKWGAQHRSSMENRPRSEGHSFRSGPVHGVVSIHKSVSRNEFEGTMPVGDKEGRFVFPEKERTSQMLKSGVKLSLKEESSLVSPTRIVKAKAARAPRSATGMPTSLSAPHAPRPPSTINVWDRATLGAAAPNRAQVPVALNNRKRPAPTRSSSPPVAQWVGQRPQKMSRVARRMNIAPPVGPPGGVRDEAMANSEGLTVRDTCPTPMGIRTNPSTPSVTGLVKRVSSTAALSQSKSKTERVASPMGHSESEDSEGVDVKSKEKWKKHVESEGRFGAVNQKMAPLFLPGKKSRVSPKEEGGDGVRRQGRSGRGFIAVRESSNVTLIEKGDPSGNAKQLRSARPGFDKSDKLAEVKPGRPPTKKGSVGDRKALTRPRRPPINGGGEVLGESDDDREELVAAVQATINTSGTACSSMFWKEMEPLFAYLAPGARESLKIQVKARELEVEEVLSSRLQSNNAANTHIPNGRMDANGDTSSRPLSLRSRLLDAGKEEVNGNWPVVRELPLSQRLLAALIIESDIDDYSSQPGLQAYGGDESTQDVSDSEQQVGAEKDQDSESEVETRRGNGGTLNGCVKRSSNDASHVSNGHRHWDSESEILNSPDLRKEDDNKHSLEINGLNRWEGKYQDLTLDERIALELQSIGLYPDQGEVVREDDQITEEIKKSQMDLKELVQSNKERLTSLEKVVSNDRAADERERERLAMIKLLESAFSKRLGTRGGHLAMSGNKQAVSKASGRPAAVTIAKESLVRWKHYVKTGESCFTEAGLRDALFCISAKDSEKKGLINGGMNSVGLTMTGSPQLKLAVSAETPWICSASFTEKADKDSCESDQLIVGTPSERTYKDDGWSSRPKEREVLLEDVVGTGGNVGSMLGGTKGKRSERERDAGHGKGAGRAGGLGAIKGERKTKTKPRQKTGPLLKAVNGLLGKSSEVQEKPGSRVKQESADTRVDGDGPLDLTHLQIPGMDDLVVNGDLGGQGQDLGSWLDFDDPGLPDAGGDFMGLDIPMDDLADLAMMM